MKATGVVRQIDTLGRIVIPMEIRTSLGFRERQDIEFFVEGDKIILQIYNESCVLCNDDRNLIYYGNKAVCARCIENMRRMITRGDYK